MNFLTSQMFEKGIRLGLKITFALMVGFLVVQVQGYQKGDIFKVFLLFMFNVDVQPHVCDRPLGPKGVVNAARRDFQGRGRFSLLFFCFRSFLLLLIYLSSAILPGHGPAQ